MCVCVFAAASCRFRRIARELLAERERGGAAAVGRRGVVGRGGAALPGARLPQRLARRLVQFLAARVLELGRPAGGAQLPNARPHDGPVRRQVPPERRLRLRPQAGRHAPARLRHSVGAQRRPALHSAPAPPHPRNQFTTNL